MAERCNRHRFNNVVVAGLFGVCLVSTLAAQQPPPDVQIKTLPRRFVADEWRIWSSPFRPHNYNSHTVRKYVVPFVILSAALIATDRKTGDLLPNTTDQTVWSGRVSQLGAAYSLAGMAGGSFLVGQLGGNDHLREAGLLGLEALGHTQVVVFAFKQITNRQRPLDQDGKGSFWEGGTSFPSGHAASAFSLATVFAYEYSDHLAAPITAYSAATLISLSRLGARRHWVSDIVVGGSLGFLIGRFTYKRNHNPRLPGSKVGQTNRLVPHAGVSSTRLDLSWHW